MCGIAGTFAYTGSYRVDQEPLLRVRDHMQARGPDAAGLWISPDRRVGLAHRRLSIIDLSEGGAQPMVSGDGRCRVVFNGEIYNYPEIRTRLESKGARFRSNSDTEALLHLYAEKGVQMVDELRGMYTFILWDERRQGVLLARDPFGIKPLYVHDDGRTLRAASQVKALLADESIEASPDPAGHVGFLLWGHVPEPYTLFRGIRMLPAGSTLWVDAEGRHSARQFYDVTRELEAIDRESSEQPQSQERLREALDDSVRHHFLADVPVGIFLSAGLDSTMLTSVATAQLGAGNLHTITLGFEEYKGTEHDETRLSTLAAHAFESIHQTIWISANSFRDNLAHLLDAMDQPTIDGVNTYFVSKIARECGLKVAISGVGGDELFGGYPSFTQIPRLVKQLGFTRHLPSMVGESIRRISSPLAARFTSSPKYAGLLEHGGTYGGAYLLRRGMFMPWELEDHLDHDMAREGWNELQTLERLEESTANICSERLKMCSLELNWYMRNRLLRDSDWAGMAHSLEIRVPLVDIELLRRIGPLLASSRPPTKLDMALAAPQPVPGEILYRRKTGFMVPVHEWLVGSGSGQAHGGRLRDWAKLVYRESAKGSRAAVVQ